MKAGAKVVLVLVFGVLLGLSVGQGCLAAPPDSRAQAVRDLTSADTQVRREAVIWLGTGGEMEDLGALASSLRDDDSEVREFAEGALVRLWSRSGDRQIDDLLRTGIKQMEQGQMSQAVDTFTRMIELRPDFAEGWNKRATVHFLLGNLDLSLKDCDEVMQRNPYHFGALSGYGMIYIKQGHLERALEYFERALDVNPNLQGAEMSVEMIRQKLNRQGKQAI